MSSKQPALDDPGKPLVEFGKTIDQMRDQLLRWRGIRGQKLTILTSGATTADCANKINELINLLQE